MSASNQTRRTAVALLAAACVSGCATETTTTSVIGSQMPKVPLDVVSDPPGAEVAYVFSLANGDDPRVGRCVTPCRLMVPNLRRVQIGVSKKGYRLVSHPSLRWAGTLVSRLEPNPAVFVFAKETAR